ncbi:MAG: OAM dimerization domain-containing protein [Kosmotogaceae bacterium]
MKKIGEKAIRPYGDTLNDGKVQLSFTLPVKSDVRAKTAAKKLLTKMGLTNPQVVYQKALSEAFTFFVVYGDCTHTVDYSKIEDTGILITRRSMEEIDSHIKENLGRKIVVVGATTGSDAHTVGLDAIMNMKGFAGHYGLERYEMIDTYNLGSQVLNMDLIAKGMEVNADALMVSQTVTAKNTHVKNLTELVELLEAENIRDRFILIVGGSRISHELARELGFDAGFGPGTYAEDVASYILDELLNRNE